MSTQTISVHLPDGAVREVPAGTTPLEIANSITEKDPEALKVVRHSAAHVMATAVLELFPRDQARPRPATDQGFFYDFYREKPFTPTTSPPSKPRWPKSSRATRSSSANRAARRPRRLRRATATS
jgi:threonyl-tRNA synthetase